MTRAEEWGGDFWALPLPPRGEKRSAVSPLVRDAGGGSRFEDKGHRAVVDDEDFHHGLKDPGFDGHIERLDGADEIIEEFGGPTRLLGAVEARTPALAHRCGQRELRDGQDLSPGLDEREVHLVLGVGEDAQLHAFFGEILGLGFAVPLLDADEEAEATADAAGGLALDDDPGLFHPLQHDLHGFSLTAAFLRSPMTLRRSPGLMIRMIPT